MHLPNGRAAAVALLLAGTAVAQEPERAADQPPAEASLPAPPAHLQQPPGTLAEPKPAEQPSAAQAPSAEGTTWVDDLHRRMERELTDLTERLDGTFGEDRRLDLERPGTYLRWRNEVRVDDRGAWSPRTSARASLQLPAFKRWVKRLQLVFSGESKGEDPTIRRLEDPGNPAFSPSIRAEQASLELRNDFFRTPATVVQAATGIRLRLPFEYFAALRFRQRLDLGWKITSRFTQEGSWTSRERFGEKTQVDFDRPVAPHTQVRWNNAGFYTGVSRGYEWATELGLAHELVSVRTAAYLAFALTGLRLPQGSAEVQLYRLFARLRRDVWRRWLFVELEPEIGWPTTVELGRHKVHAITLRLDIILDGRTPRGGPAEARPAAPPAPPGR
ncbi:MAG TPA: hypothetical protein VIV57_01810 [Anaeromyxobacter sp.]